MAAAPKRNSWLVPALLGAFIAAMLCGMTAIAGWYFFLRGSEPQETPEPIAQFLIPTASPTQPTATLLPTVAFTPIPSTSATTAAPAATSAPTIPPTRPRPTATAGPITGKIVFSVDRGERPEDKSLWIMNVDGSGAKQIVEGASSPVFSPDGASIAYYHWRDGIYIADVSGYNARKIVSETDAKFLAWSHDGKWIAFRSQPTRGGNEFVAIVSPDGSFRRNVAPGSMPSWSPDDKQIAFHTCRGTVCGIHRATLDGSDPILVTNDAGANPAWSPDGKKILYVVEANQVKQLFTVNADGSDKKPLTSGSAMHVSGQWSADGNYIFYRTPESGSWAIWRMNADGTHPIKLIEDAPPSIDWPFEKLAVFTQTK